MYHPKKNCVLVLAIVVVSAIAINPAAVLSQDLSLQTVRLPVMDGVFNHVDGEKRMLYLSLDKEGKIIQEINFASIESVYLIQGRTEKLREYLIGGTVGGAVGLSSLFWGNKLADLIGGNNSNNSASGDSAKNPNNANWLKVVTVIGGGAGAGVLAQHLKNRGEEGVVYFPVYDPKVKQTNPNSSINFSDIGNLKTKLREKESFIHVTLKESKEK